MNLPEIKYGNLSHLNGDFTIGTGDKFFIKVLDVGSKCSVSLKDFNMIGKGNHAIVLCEDVTIDEGNVNIGSIDFASWFSVKYPAQWQKPEELSITFVDSDKLTFYKAIHKLVSKTPLTKWRAINPKNLHEYSLKIEIHRYDFLGKSSLVSRFTVFPAELPQWAGSYGNSGKVTYSVKFIIVDWELGT